MYLAFLEGRGGAKDPSEGWYSGELWYVFIDQSLTCAIAHGFSNTFIVTHLLVAFNHQVL